MTPYEPVTLDAEIIVLRGILFEVYYLLKDRNSKDINDAMCLIKRVFPDVKNYEKAKDRQM